MPKKEFKVTPYEVSGKIDYEKLARDFGIKPMVQVSKPMKTGTSK